ncbi:protein-tyrosine phosphatase family protein [Pontiellaceae bacterium B1224]|nr:protein-tyrosine phosphatase family protein [Pontiellaceae bacterium B1224]
MRLRKLETNTPGTLYLHSMPGRYEDLSSFIERIEAEGISHIICLNSDEEIKTKSPDYYHAIQRGGIPVKRTTFPIPDFGVAEDQEAFYALVRTTVGMLQKETNILVHCAGGIGRTGTFAGCILNALGLPLILLEESGSYPETDKQFELLQRAH